MSLSAQEQHTLHCIEGDLTGSDPKLAALLTTFTRLTSDEEMPVREKITAIRWEARAVRVLSRHPVLRWTVPLLWAVIAIGVAATVAAFSHGGGNACVHSWPVACRSTAPVHSSSGTAPAHSSSGTASAGTAGGTAPARFTSGTAAARTAGGTAPARFTSGTAAARTAGGTAAARSAGPASDAVAGEAPPAARQVPAAARQVP